MGSKISTVVAVYHGEKYLAEQLESLFHQTRQPDEIVIGDDSGDDGCFRIIESIRKDFSGELRYIRNTSRLGFLRNFINLANIASGDIIFSVIRMISGSRKKSKLCPACWNMILPPKLPYATAK